MGSWGNIAVGFVCLFAAGIVSLAVSATKDGSPVVFLAYALGLAGTVLLSIGVIARGVKLGNEETVRRR